MNLNDDPYTGEADDRVENGARADDDTSPALTLEELRMELLTVEEVAKLLRIGKNLAYELIHRGVIPHIPLGNRYLVPRHALAMALRRMTITQTRRPPSQAAV